MLEFYPMPTNLNHHHGTGGMYPHHHHQNHGGARFLDNISSGATAANTQGLNNNNNNCVQQQQLQMSTSSSAHAICQSNNSNSNNSNSPISISASSTASLTAQSISALSATPVSTTGANTASASSLSSNNTISSSSCSSSSCSTPTYTNTTASSIISSASCSASTFSSSASSTSSSLLLSSSSSSKLSAADCSGRTEVGHIKCEKNYEICEGCGQKIHDRYLMNVGDTNWHEQCLACCYCGMQLHHTCHVRNSKLYCKLDYDRLFGIKCASCCHPILPQEMVMRPIPNFIFHLSCFVCFACRLPLQKGEQFMLRDGQLFCYRHDLEKEMYLAAAAAAAAQHCGFVGLDDDDLIRPRDGRRGPKRPRTILTSQQRKQFKASFDQSPKPCRKVREALAKDTGLSVRVVQVWFQNQRAKMKKIQRKAKNGGGSTANGGRSAGASAGEDKDKDKDEKCIKQESGSGSENGYLMLGDSAFASQPLNPNLPFSPDDYPANSNDSFCSSDLSLDGSNFDQLDDDTDSLSLNNLELQSTGSSGNPHHSNPHDIIANLNTSLINPIDKLYLMQNSYFNTDQ